MNLLKKARRYGNIPRSVGFDPHLAWRTYCPLCGSKANLFAEQLPHGTRHLAQHHRVLQRNGRLRRCKACRAGFVRVSHKMTRAQALHKNDIRSRSTTMPLQAARFGVS